MNYLPNEKKMSIKELSLVLNVGESTIRRSLEKQFPGTLKNGVKTELNIAQVTAIKLDLEKHHNLASTGELPKTELEKELIIRQAWELMNEKIERLQSENAEMLPKAEFYDQVTESKDAIDMGDSAQVLNINGIGRNKLFEILRNANVLKSNNLPYQRFIDSGYFRVIETKYSRPDGSIHVNLKTVVYQSGLDYIRRLINERY
jgi:phage antirepressor YoqD-like protein